MTRDTKNTDVPGLGLHVIQYPTGMFGYVGAIPTALCREVMATRSDVMGGRAHRGGVSGGLMTWRAPTFPTRSEAVRHAEAHGYRVKPTARKEQGQ